MRLLGLTVSNLLDADQFPALGYRQLKLPFKGAVPAGWRQDKGDASGGNDTAAGNQEASSDE